MPDFSDEVIAARPVWRRTTSGAPSRVDDEMPLHCGGPTLTVDERFELMRARKREMLETRAREREEAEAREAAERRQGRGRNVGDEDEDEEKATERARNDRYAVKLLRQENDAWAGGGSDLGVLG